MHGVARVFMSVRAHLLNYVGYKSVIHFWFRRNGSFSSYRRTPIDVAACQDFSRCERIRTVCPCKPTASVGCTRISSVSPPQSLIQAPCIKPMSLSLCSCSSGLRRVSIYTYLRDIALGFNRIYITTVVRSDDTCSMPILKRPY